MKVTKIIGALAMAVCAPAFASGKDVGGSSITQLFYVTANVNTMLQLTALDGSALDPNVTMAYSLLKKSLAPADVDAILATNDTANNIVASVPYTPVLFSGTNQIPLTVKMNGVPLTQAETVFQTKTLFSTGDTAAIDFNFSPTWPTAAIPQGAYKGTVTVMLQQQTPS
ncbi:CS1 type fimbrial major subunit [Robbsia sp. Bb-Pol-6]|uniref:CS1 type fimbrial major subunit n=1 Tax=Robbsia betulipollinis TaxID=2981849 RepID=A0ABT3ZL31_9BURK|nr:CS1 type fimbrial major subunit [Robbsia betulipollinis]MCY0387239.1 CS1 type fimbrial major subunit [Robbsia betulipollinis]